MFVARLAAIAALTLSATSAVLAQVSWTGAAGDNLWFSPGNWSTGIVPQPGQSVTINVPGSDPTIILANGGTPITVSIASLNSTERLRLDNAVTLTVANAACSAPLLLNGGTLDSGTWAFTPPAAVEPQAFSSTVRNTIVAGDINLTVPSGRVRLDGTARFSTLRLAANNTSVGFLPGYTLHDGIIALGSGAVALEAVGTSTLTIAPTGSVVFDPAFSGTFSVTNSFWFGGTLSVINQGLIRSGPLGSLAFTNAALTNQGLIRSLGGTLTIGQSGVAAPFTNAASGTLLIEGGVARLFGTWVNQGIIDFTGSRLDLGGSFTTASLAGLTVRNASPVDILGNWDNTAASFTLNQSTGSWRLNGGTITGGTLNTADRQRLIFAPTSNQLSAVSYTADIILDQVSARLRLSDGASAPSIRLAAPNTSVAFPPNALVNTAIVAEGSSAGTRAVEVSPSGPLNFAPSATIQTQGTWTGTLQIGGTFWYSAITNLSNLGSIAVTGNGRTLTINPASLTNNAGASISASASSTLSISPATFTNAPGAAVIASASTLNIQPSASWSNSGSIAVSDGTLNMSGTWSTSTPIVASNTAVTLNGSFTTASALRLNRTGGTVTLAGNLDNAGDTLPFSNTTGSWTLLGGTITGGSISFADNHRLDIGSNNSNTLSGVALANELAVNLPNSRVRLINGTTAPSIRLTNFNSSVAFPPGFTINFPITADSTAAGTQAIETTAAGPLTLGPSGSITIPQASLTQRLNLGNAFWFSASNFVNQGTIEVLNGRALSLGSSGFPAVNQGTLRARNASTITAVLAGPQTPPDLADTNTNFNASGSYSFPAGLTVATGVAAALNGTWSVPGPLVLNQGTLTLGGTFSPADIANLTRTAGVVNIADTFDLQGGTFTLTNATGSFHLLSNATVRDGTLARVGGNNVLCAGIATFDSVTFPQEFILQGTASARARFLGTTSAPSYRLSGFNNSIGFPPGTVLNTDIILDGDQGARGVELNGQDGTLTLGPASRIIATVPNISLTIGNYWFSGNQSITTQGLIDNIASLTLGGSATWTNLDTNTRTLTGGRYRIRNSISTTPTIRINNADLEFTGGSFISLDLAENRGRLSLANGTDAGLNASIGNPDRVTVFINSGLLELSPGSAFQVGSSGSAADFTQTPTGDARFILAGDSPAQHGRLRVFGNVAYDGTLSARTADGFERQCGMIFDVIDADGQRTGGFSTLDLPAPTEDNVVLAFAVGPDVRLTVSSRADFNQDGFLDFFDFSEYVDCFEGFGCPPGLNADFNDDGFVDFFDFSDFVFRFEAGC